ncbi:MAG: nickel pincer cofactor biosynthesis protein LarB [Nitrospirae bacterium]|nr:nickel pincer cofactor biosynthesis protein LarB [Nitrospirota bacterium]
MDRGRLEALLEEVRAGKLEVGRALEALRHFPSERLGFAVLDHHRDLRQGVPEAVLCEGKTPAEVVAIVKRLAKSGAPVLATRADPAIGRAIRAVLPAAVYHRRARMVVVAPRAASEDDEILILTAGTADLPVAEEAAVTARALGSGVETVCDVGVAGVHRVLDRLERLRAARVLVVVAGMDGALPSLVGGLVPQPVIAVPTSRGYGAHFGGLAPLLTMLNSCAAGVAVVNIDNGFGAGVLAHRINRMAVAQREPRARRPARAPLTKAPAVRSS